jgi:PAS domain S-box-containing protein
MMLRARFPFILWWGPQFIQLYNDPYRPIPGDKHPKSMGQPASECWKEIWHIIGPMIEVTFSGKAATGSDDLLLMVNRRGFMEETHFKVSYSPIPDPTVQPTGVGGVLATIAETTEQVFGERRLRTLCELGAGTAGAKTPEQACRAAAESFLDNRMDVPFALFYLLDPEDKQAHLVAGCGFDANGPANPVSMNIGDDSAWPLARIVQNKEPEVVSNLAGRFGQLPSGEWSQPPHSAMVLPFRVPGRPQIDGVLIAGLSPHRELDEGYRAFFDLAAAQIAVAVRNARTCREERQRAGEAVAQAKREWELTFDAASDLIAVIDRNYGIVRVNKAMASKLGVSPGECAGKRCYEVVHELDAPPLFCPHRQLFEDGTGHSSEIHIAGLGGDFIVDASPLYNSAGELIGSVHVCHDITVRKQTEEKIRHQKAIVETINLIFYQALTCRTERQLGESCLNALEAVTGSKISFISEIRPHGGVYGISVSNPGWDICSMVDESGRRGPPAEFKIQGLYARVLKNGQSLLTNDPSSHPDSIGTPEGHPPLTAFLGVPLKRDGNTIGMVGLGNREGGYTPEHQSAVEAIAPAIVQALLRKRAEESLGMARDELELRVQERTAELANANEKLRQFPSKLIEAQEEERKRLASELHDSIGQTLAAFKFRMEFILLNLREGKTKDAVRATEEFVPILQRSIDETRAIYMGLRPKVLEDFGVVAALRWLREELLELYPQQHIEVDIGVDERDIPHDLVIPIFRIAQEALNNASKHSRAEWVDVSLCASVNGIELAVADDGIGMDLGQILQSSTARSLGLSSMRERADLTGGKFEIRSTPDEGTTIRVCWAI